LQFPHFALKWTNLVGVSVSHDPEKKNANTPKLLFSQLNLTNFLKKLLVVHYKEEKKLKIALLFS